MGCFLTCFGGAKDAGGRRRRPNRRLAVDGLGVDGEVKALVSAKVSSCVEEQRADELEVKECREKGEILSCGNVKKKVTFDLNVKTYDTVAIEEVVEEDEDGVEGVGEVSFPVNHRYQDCGGSSEDEDYGDEYEDCEFSDEDGEEILAEGNEESYDSFFSLSIEEERNGVREVNSPKLKSCSDSDEHKPGILATCNVRDRSQYVHSVLNPVENLTQWKEVKVRSVAPSKDLNKENVISGQENKIPPSDSELIVKPKKVEYSVNLKTIPVKQEISVDASLSTWLVTSDNSSVEGPQQSFSPLSNSSISREDRPILGALTLDDIKQSSVTSTPRKSPSRSPDETPIIGNVGRYWNCEMERDEDSHSSWKSGTANAKNSCREDQRVKCHSIPFEVRLEKALNKGNV